MAYQVTTWQTPTGAMNLCGVCDYEQRLHPEQYSRVRERHPGKCEHPEHGHVEIIRHASMPEEIWQGILRGDEVTRGGNPTAAPLGDLEASMALAGEIRCRWCGIHHTGAVCPEVREPKWTL